MGQQGTSHWPPKVPKGSGIERGGNRFGRGALREGKARPVTPELLTAQTHIATAMFEVATGLLT